MPLYDTYSLLPVPQRTWMSTVDESRRARLPDFTLEADPADALRRWARAIYFPDLSGAWIHIYICIGLICVLMLFTSAVIFVRQARLKTFWLVRIVRKPRGVLFVPNSMNCYVACMSTAGIVLIVWYSQLYQWFRLERRVVNFWAWFLLVWTPLYPYVHLCTWGLYHSLPHRFASGAFPTEQKLLSRILTSPRIPNIAGLVLPCLHATSVIVPALICQRKWNSSLSLYQQWLEKYSAQTELSQDMLVGAQQFWYMTFSLMRAAAVCLLVWIAWAVVVGLVLNVLSFQLLRILQKQVQLLRRKVANLELTTASWGYGLPKRSSVATPSVTKNLYTSEVHQDSTEISSGSPNSAAGATEQVTLTSPSLLPRFITDSMAEESGSQATKNHRQQLHYLTAAYIHVISQAIGIIPPMLSFLTIAVWLTIRLPGSFESPEVEYHRYVVVTIIVASYACIASATIVLSSIAWRTYEPVLHFRGVLSAECTQIPDKSSVVQRLLRRMGSGKSSPSDSTRTFGLSRSNGAQQTPSSPSGKGFRTFSTGHYKAQSLGGDTLRGVRIDHGFAVRRFSQSIVLSEDAEDVELVLKHLPSLASTPHSQPPQYKDSQSGLANEAMPSTLEVPRRTS